VRKLHNRHFSVGVQHEFVLEVISEAYNIIW